MKTEPKKPNDTQRTTINNICNVNNDKGYKPKVGEPTYLSRSTERVH